MLQRSFPRLLFLAFVLLVTTASSALALNGRLIDKRTGQPVANAEVLIVGLTGSVKTDADGRFSWKPDPVAPFELLVVLPGGTLTRPVFVKSVDAAAVLTISIESAVNEEVTVTAGLAPSIDTAPGAGMTMLSGRDVASRQPANLMQALENVPGVNQVSEGHAAVPAVRGLARGRTLILIDGARVTSERRVGPSATFMDPFGIGSVDVARGPGSVAYGSDAFGGVISVQTPRPVIGGPWKARLWHAGSGIPDRGGSAEIKRGMRAAAVLVQAHARRAEDYDGPRAVVLNSGLCRSRVPGRGSISTEAGACCRLAGRVTSDAISSGPATTRPVRGFFLLLRIPTGATASYEVQQATGLDLVRVQAFLGTINQRTDQDRIPTATVTRQLCGQTSIAGLFGARHRRERARQVRLEFGADLNGRAGLEAHDIQIDYDLPARRNVANGQPLYRTRRNAWTQASLRRQNGALASWLHATGGARVDFVSSKNTGGFFGTSRFLTRPASGFAALTVGPFDGLSFTGQVSRGFRDPTLSDRFYRGPSGRGFITGNPDLDPETSVQLDFGARYTTGRTARDGICLPVPHHGSGGALRHATDFFFFRNRGQAQYRGFEVEAQADLGRGVTLEFAGQTARGRAL